jgi:hypothetical protein
MVAEANAAAWGLALEKRMPDPRKIENIAGKRTRKNPTEELGCLIDVVSMRDRDKLAVVKLPD